MVSIWTVRRQRCHVLPAEPITNDTAKTNDWSNTLPALNQCFQEFDDVVTIFECYRSNLLAFGRAGGDWRHIDYRLILIEFVL
jgi:hypothetical protein